MKREKNRPTHVERHVKAGCTVCHGTRAHWTGGQAQGVAAKHFDETGHPTWATVDMLIRYGGDAPSKPRAAPARVVAGPVVQGFVGLPPKASR